MIQRHSVIDESRLVARMAVSVREQYPSFSTEAVWQEQGAMIATVMPVAETSRTGRAYPPFPGIRAWAGIYRLRCLVKQESGTPAENRHRQQEAGRRRLHGCASRSHSVQAFFLAHRPDGLVGTTFAARNPGDDQENLEATGEFTPVGRCLGYQTPPARTGVGREA